MIVRPTRRDFLLQGALAGAAGSVLSGGGPAFARQDSPNEKVRFASIGVGGKGDSDTNDAGKYGEIVALCDVEREHPRQDGREVSPTPRNTSTTARCYEDMGDKIDAVTVSTPDHSARPGRRDGHEDGQARAFVQKPLTWSIEEARLLRALAAEKKLCTQMGNQGTAADGFRRGVEVIRSGILGSVKEIHVWTNRPIWPQGIARPKDTPGRFPTTSTGTSSSASRAGSALQPRLSPISPGEAGSTSAPAPWATWPATPSTSRPWRCGLFDPETVEVVDTSGIVDRETYPAWSIIKTHFGERAGRAPLDLNWYDGGKKLPAREAIRDPGQRLHAAKLPEQRSAPGRREGARSFPPTITAASTRSSGPTASVRWSQPKVETTLAEVSPGHFKEWVEAITAKDPSEGPLELRVLRPIDRDRPSRCRRPQDSAARSSGTPPR